MMHMMNTTGLGFGMPLLWGIHILSVIAFFTGILFLIVLAIKTFTHAQLKMWALWLIIVGALLCLATIAIRGGTWTSREMGDYGSTRMMDNDADDEQAQNGTMNGGMGMSMNGMSMMLQGKTGDAFDSAFIQMMIPHHQGAIDMAKDALKNAKHDELKTLANDIITSQQREIDMMKTWQQTWGYTK